jgi:hypothetical protein
LVRLWIANQLGAIIWFWIFPVEYFINYRRSCIDTGTLEPRTMELDSSIHQSNTMTGIVRNRLKMSQKMATQVIMLYSSHAFREVGT